MTDERIPGPNPEDSGEDNLTKAIKRFLEEPYWIPELDSGEVYTRLHDDNDGTFTGILSVQFDRNGDAYIATDVGKLKNLRFRTSSGGGKSLRVKNALMILALAIKLDNAENPQE